MKPLIAHGLAAIALVAALPAQVEMLAIEEQISAVEEERTALEVRSADVMDQIEGVEDSLSAEQCDLEIFDYNLQISQQNLRNLHTRAAAKRTRISLYRERLGSVLTPLVLGDSVSAPADELGLVAIAQRYTTQIGMLEEDLAAIEAQISQIENYRARERQLISRADNNIQHHTRRMEDRQRSLEEIQQEIALSDGRLNALIAELENLRPTRLVTGATETSDIGIELPAPEPMPVVLVNLPNLELAMGDGAGPQMVVYDAGQGVDIEVPEDTVIRSVQVGQVVYAGPLMGFGNVVIIEHDDGIRTITASVSEVEVTVGDDVRVGTPIAVAGRLRRTGAPGFHFEVRRGEDVIDAAQWMGVDDLETALLRR